MSSVIYLQGIGEAPAKMVSELSHGDIFIKNYGYKYRIIACESLSKNVYEMTFESLNSTDPGCRYTKTVRGSTMVGIHENGDNGHKEMSHPGKTCEEAHPDMSHEEWEESQEVDEDMRLLHQLHNAQKKATERKRQEDEEKERLRRQNQEVSANKQVANQFASSASEESTSDKILTFMAERKLSKAEIKKREDVGDNLPKDEFKKKYSKPKPPAKSWKDVLWATATNIVKGQSESVELDEIVEPLAEMPFEFPDERKAKQFDLDVENSAIGVGNRVGNKVTLKGVDRKWRSTIKKYMKRSGGKFIKDSVELGETRDRDELIDLMNKTGARVASDTLTDKGRVTPKTNQAKRINIKARERLGLSDEVVKEEIADGKRKTRGQRRLDVAISKIGRAFPNHQSNFKPSRIKSAASRLSRGHDPESMKREPDDVFQTTADVRAAEKLMNKTRKQRNIQDSVQKNILSQLKNFDLSGDGLDVPSINNKAWGTEGLKKGDGKTSTTGKDKKTGYEDPLKGYPYNT